MSENAWLVLYCLLVLATSLFGGYLPFLGRVSHSRLQLYLSASAGVMLGAAFFHVMPDAMKISGDSFGWWMSLAVVGLFALARFVAPPSHEVDHGCADHGHDHAHHHEGETHGEKHSHENHGGKANGGRSAAPALAGWMAVAGLTVHTFMNGVGLAGAVQFDAADHAKAASASTLILP